MEQTAKECNKYFAKHLEISARMRDGINRCAMGSNHERHHNY